MISDGVSLASLLVMLVVGLAGLVRALTPHDAAETAWVRSVLRQLYCEGGFDDGVLLVRVDRQPREVDPRAWYHDADRPLGWMVDTVLSHRWTSSRAVLVRWLREHYRETRSAAAREVA